MRHLRNQAEELVKDLRENGLNGIHFIYTEVNDPTDPADDSMGREAAEAWDRDYCLVTLEADSAPFCAGYDSDNPYYQVHFDHHSFLKDLREKFVEYFGEDTIKNLETHHGWEIRIDNCCETEVYRRSSAWEDFEGNTHDEPFDPLVTNK